MKTVLVTGGTGFIAQALLPKLVEQKWKVKATLRDKTALDWLPGKVCRLAGARIKHRIE